MAKATRKPRAFPKRSESFSARSVPQPSIIDTVAADSAAAASPAPISDINVQITLIHGGITNVRAPIAIGASYDGLAFAGPTAAFDRLLDSWMTPAVALGIIG